MRGPQVVAKPPLRKVDYHLHGTQEGLRAELERVFHETDRHHPVGERKRRNMKKLSLQLRLSLKAESGADVWEKLGSLINTYKE